MSSCSYIARRAAQKERVRILYRRALKDTLNWAVHRHLFYKDASDLRDRFDANKHLEDLDTIDRMIDDAEATYNKFRHPDPYIGFTTGAPIHVSVPNTDQRGNDYSEMALAYRPSHADATYDFKYGVRAVQGGGRSSARETIGRVAAGAVAKIILRAYAGTEVLAYVSQVHKVVLPEGVVDHETLTLNQIESNIVRCPDPEYVEKMIAAIDTIRVRGDSVGGVVTCIARNVPRGLGSPVFDKLEAELSKAVMSLPATKAFEFGSGFAGTFLTGSEHNDEFYTDEHGKIRTRTNRSGGIQGGISNGEIINMRVAFKPTATIGKKQLTVTRDRQEIELVTRGRHDPCVVPRAVPMVEAMVALVLVDQLIGHHGQCQLFPVNPDLQ